MSSRKRAAPGANPTAAAAAAQQRMQQNYMTDSSAADAMGRWNATPDDPANFLDDSNFYPLMQQQQQQAYTQPMATPSNTLTRRQMNNALVPARPTFEAPTDPWSGFDVDSALVPQPVPTATEEAPEPDSIEKLEEMAQKAKKEAQTKRKSIPPFVQKLSSFLEERKNEDLIRWSENGDSFIVLDEDEFAKTLIPELFKHNKYASFVRQLNMYGFHKCVGLSDNSMRASERKNKSPSEYANPYFRRGHPNLLWLINKPKSDPKPGTGKAAKATDADNSDDEAGNEDGTSHHATVGALPASRALPSSEGSTAPIQKKEIGVIREELRKVREQQMLILGAINRIQQNNNDLYNQAMMFQNQHDRHQNSINAILNFLANVFRKTLEDQSSNQNVNDIISSLMSNQAGAGGHGSVVDLGDFFQSQMDHSGTTGGPPKRARGLLPPIPGQTAQSSRTASVSTPYQGSHAQMGHVTELNEASPSESPSLRQELEANPQERMMKIINDHNNANSSPMDLPKVEELVANTPNTLSNDQRSQLVNFMAGQANSPSSNSTPASATPSTQTRSRTSASAHGSGSAANAAPNGAAASTGNSSTSAAPPSLSPIMRSPQMVVPSLSQISANQEELARLQQLQSEQDAKINELGSLLGPLSPSGRIPGLDDPDTYFNQSGVDDFDQLFNSDAFVNDPAFLNTDDFSFPGDATDKPQEDKDTPGSTGTEEIQRDDLADTSGPETRGSKRQRTT